MTSRRRASARSSGVVRPSSLSVALLASPAAAQMPDLSQMNGRSLPAPDAPAGSATVRVMRETLGNNVVGQEVTLTDANGVDASARARPTTAGRATFDGLRPGTPYTAVAVVVGERLVSQPFTQPSSGGVRVVLVAGLGRGRRGAGGGRRPRPAATPAPAGSITLGTQSRMIVEQADEFVEVFVLADLVNTTDGPVSLPSPIVFTPPAGALGTAVLEGVDGRGARERPHRGEGPAAVRADVDPVRLPAAQRHRPRRRSRRPIRSAGR